MLIIFYVAYKVGLITLATTDNAYALIFERHHAGRYP